MSGPRTTHVPGSNPHKSRCRPPPSLPGGRRGGHVNFARLLEMRPPEQAHSLQALEVVPIQRKVHVMYFGGAIAMIAIGAILSFAVRDAVPGVDLTAVGYILMVVGALGIVLTMAVTGRRRDARDVPRDDVPPRA